MAPLISPRSIARAFATADLDSTASPFQSIPRQSRSSSHSSPPLNVRRSIAATSHLVSRLNDNANIVPETYGTTQNGPDAGTVVGIVLGSVCGFLLLLWLIYTVTNLGNNKKPQQTYDVETLDTASVVTRKSRRRRHSQSRRSASTRPRETVETIRRERVVPAPMPPPQTQTERIVVEERSRSRAQAPAPAPPPPMPPPPPRVVEDDDEVVVIEENTPPRRRESKQHKRRSSRRSSERRSDSRPGGYREVDPYRYAGGNASVRSVSRRRSPSRGGY